jgi:hypothetical protein
LIRAIRVDADPTVPNFVSSGFDDGGSDDDEP